MKTTKKVPQQKVKTLLQQREEQKVTRIKELKDAKKSFRLTMLKLYPDFTPRKWATTSYRSNHPQPTI